MYFLIFFVISILLVIPTWGISLLVFFIVKNWFDGQAMNNLLGAAAMAMRNDVSEDRYHINQAAIRKVFHRFGASPVEVKVIGNGAVTFFWGLVRHPMINSGKVFSVRFAYTPRSGWSNTVFIKATAGIDHTVLSADDIEAMASEFIPLTLKVSQKPAIKFDFTRPKSVDEIRHLIANLGDLKQSRKYPNFTYGRMGDFVESEKVGVEYFGGYSGMRFWITVGDFDYAVHVENLDRSKEDSGGIEITAYVDGVASKEDRLLDPTSL